MSLRSAFLLVFFVLLAVFALLNWGAFMAPATLSVGFGRVQAPLGLILLAAIAVLCLLFLSFVVYLQGSVLMEARRHARELGAQRELADKAEASRFTELRSFIAEQVAGLHERIDRLDRDFGNAFERNESALATYVGELGDRVDRLSADPGARSAS